MTIDFLAGCVGGAAGVIVGHPLDTVKVRLQIQSADNIKYKGTFDCLRTTVRNESVSGLYKGISSPLFGVAGVNALIFGVYGALRPYVHGSPGNDTLAAHFVAGSISGAVQSFVASPMELVKTRMQLNESTTTPNSSLSSKPPSSWDVLKTIYKTEGGMFRGVFKGWGVTVAREIPGFGTYFATYEALTSKSGREVGTFGMMMAGGLAGVMSWIVTFPIDVVKTRLQSDVSHRYSGAIDCLKKTYATEGYSAFSRGLVSTIIRAFPTNAATFTVVTWIMRWADQRQIETMQDGKAYMEEILRESRDVQHQIDNVFRLPVAHYLHAMSLGSSCANFTSKYSLSAKNSFNFHDLVSSYNSDGLEASRNEGFIGENLQEVFENEKANSSTTYEASELSGSTSSSTCDNFKSSKRTFSINNSETSSNPETETEDDSHGTSLFPLKVESQPTQTQTPAPATHTNPQVQDLKGQREPSVATLTSNNSNCCPDSNACTSQVMDEGSSTVSKIQQILNLSIFRSFILQFLDRVLPTIRLCTCWDDSNCVCCY